MLNNLYDFLKNIRFNDLNSCVKIGMIIITAFILLFGIWACFVPLNSAAIAQGTVSLLYHKKTIQHLEGGVIKNIFVKDGDFVKAGQKLIELSNVSAESSLGLLTNQLYDAQATIDRLVSERDNFPEIKFTNPIFENTDNPEIKKILENQKNIFEIRQQTLSTKINILKKKIKQLAEEITSLKSQKLSAYNQTTLIEKELGIVEELLKTGDETQQKLLYLKKQLVELYGNVGAIGANISKAQQSIGETKLQIIDLKTERLNEILESLSKAQNLMIEFKEKTTASKDILDRLVISAPQSGIVSGCKYHTIGGVISPGVEIMTITPQNDKLIIEAKVLPQDIDVVKVGLKSKIRLLAYRTRFTPLFEGTVFYVSPDKFTDQTTGASYYISYIEINEKELSRAIDISLYPGMPAEALIITGSRTFLKYMLDPLKKSFSRAFREE